VLKEGKIYVLKNAELRAEITQLHHDILAVKYKGQWKTVKLVTRNYWWLEVTRNVRRYMKKCDLCQRMKNRIEEIVGKLKLSKILEKLWTHLTLDFIMKLPVVARKNTILVVHDRLSKMIHFVATTEDLARLFRNNV